MIPGSVLILLLAGSGALLLLGIVLYRFGLGRRKGNTPFCRKCDCNLTGIDSSRCPECGVELREKTIAYGERRRRSGIIIIGSVIMLFGAVGFLGSSYLFIKHTNWNRFKPTSWVITDTDASWSGIGRGAYWELTKRVRAGRVSTQDLEILIDRCLQRQQAGAASWKTNASVEFLGECYRAGLLSESQGKTFFDQIVKLKLQVRPRVMAGDDIPCVVLAQSFAPRWLEVEAFETDVFVDGQLRTPKPFEMYVNPFRRGGRWAQHPLRIPSFIPGWHTLEARATIRALGESVSPGSPEREVCHKGKRTARMQFEVLASAPPDYVMLVDDPSLRDELIKCIQPKDFRIGEGATIIDEAVVAEHLFGTFRAKRLPVNVAFRIFVCLEDGEFPAGEVYGRKGKPEMFGHVHWRYKGPSITSVDVILRSSEAIARKTLDLFEIWDGELVYESVPVTDAKPGWPRRYRPW